ncbi:ead/Ea22-like family protein [Pseudomonas aeruginosa]|uniref:ead/Ea22-like family protein n=1 Tax=Pseudomonas aeruginosa TaxID=287 RepID=UPI0021E94E7C|nr:ead/Ea22-like family protein [Pseudomonas aeruginosa]MCV3976398.1 ead/Ea22-like family protein [Pseudomonas aeruginosa]MDI3613400.1 ead/Ea22-like family protein [Pseudomonas aeruginosa]MDI4012875.1 ead/Ea22-like family protein [Pseudomonas aeruginosa]MDI4025807.1 ead/Ea22-like family protein [Pseudomonas aeruginosa]
MDTNKLKELAEKLAPAYQQPWESHRHSASAVTVGAVGEDGEYSDFIDVRISDYSAFDEHDDELGQWIAAANPQAILKLIAEVERLRIGLKGDFDLDAWLEWTREKDQIKAEIEALRRFAGEAYQVLGALDAPENVLDNASDAANGVPLRNETLLPFFAEDYEALRKDAERYRWLRERDLETIRQGGVFAGMTPENIVLNQEDLDAAIDAALEGATQ